jgi:hypothetical protein
MQRLTRRLGQKKIEKLHSGGSRRISDSLPHDRRKIDNEGLVESRISGGRRTT